jgi:hypothetical protein
MRVNRTTDHSLLATSLRNFLFAFGLAGSAVICRAALQPVTPAIGPYILTFPAIMAAGIFWGTQAASAAAVFAGMATCWLILEPSLFSTSPFNSAQVNTLLFVPSCAAIIWGTDRLRRAVARASVAEARLGEVFRQVPAAVAILQVSVGRNPGSHAPWRNGRVWRRACGWAALRAR